MPPSYFNQWSLVNVIDARNCRNKTNMQVNISLSPRDATWRSWPWSSLAHVMICCLTASSHYLNQCWLISNWNHGNKFDATFNQNIIFCSKQNVFHMFSAKNWQFCAGWVTANNTYSMWYTQQNAVMRKLYACLTHWYLMTSWTLLIPYLTNVKAVQVKHNSNNTATCF